MSLSAKGFSTNKDTKLNTSNKSTTLNPNAAEFVPSALRSPSGGTANNTDVMRLDASGASKKAVFDRTESSISNNSDDEVHQYWRRQLPDDITPDFKVGGEDELQGPGNISLAGLSIHDGIESSRFSPLAGSSHFLSKQQEIMIPTYGEDQSAAFMNLPISTWDKQFVNDDQHFTNGSEGHPYNGDSSAGFLSDLLSEHAILDDTEINPVELLALQFPGFAAESLADVYYANGCDLNSTIEMMTQLENLSPKTLPTPNLSALDFPALPVPDAQNGLSKYAGDDLQQNVNPYRSIDKDSLLLFKSPSSGTSRSATDFASAVRKIASQDSSQWKYERNGLADVGVGSSRSSQLLASSYNGHGRSVYGDKLQSYGASRASPAWLDTGDAVASMYSESREEARDHARLRNAYFEQARQAYLIGNKALAKELSVKGHLHNMQMKAAHGKASESIYRQRNPISPELQSYGRGRDRLIDLHGLHVSEAISKLKHDLSVLRSMARSMGQRLQVFICVGTGHHTKGARAQARLPVAVERYLLEEESLDYTETQPGMLRVVIY
ncbi:polyadenylate-binding protein-interacting protein 7 isoform X2 [Magnolia sinica]|uniref:polyadenylate-binding protein-interacting protein 7 isoform X2 n=1 Tax=Magnolia sinica TaxID=86752 RepID=UPI00265AD949|nr:polyadenylate-binding protein-interacting protein 7 isoform X2 [Magnolia sinica]